MPQEASHGMENKVEYLFYAYSSMNMESCSDKLPAVAYSFW